MSVQGGKSELWNVTENGSRGKARSGGAIGFRKQHAHHLNKERARYGSTLADHSRSNRFTPEATRLEGHMHFRESHGFTM